MALVSSVGGVVTSAPEGISCPPTCEADFATGTSVVLTAGPGSVFTERTWSGACTGTAATCAVTMDVDRAVTVTYRQFVPLQVQATNDQDVFGSADGVVEVVIGNTTHTCRVGDGSTRTCSLPSTPAGTKFWFVPSAVAVTVPRFRVRVPTMGARWPFARLSCPMWQRPSRSRSTSTDGMPGRSRRAIRPAP